MTYWNQIKRHWYKTVPDREIARQMVEHARENPNRCAGCQHGEPAANTSKNQLAGRVCMVGLYVSSYDDARECPKFRPQSPLRLYRLSDHRELSQRRLAAIVGVSHNTIKQYETGRRNLKYQTAVKYAKALGCEPGELM